VFATVFEPQIRNLETFEELHPPQAVEHLQTPETSAGPPCEKRPRRGAAEVVGA
jgi:hypothetical protein